MALTGFAPQALALEDSVDPAGGASPDSSVTDDVGSGGNQSGAEASALGQGLGGETGNTGSGLDAGGNTGASETADAPSDQDTRSDIEGARDDLDEKAEARDTAKAEYDRAYGALKEANDAIVSDVDAIHEEKKEILDEAQGAFEAAQDASDEAKEAHEETGKDLEAAQRGLDAAAKADGEAWERLDGASYAILEELDQAQEQLQKAEEGERQAAGELNEGLGIADGENRTFDEPGVVEGRVREFIDARSDYEGALGALNGESGARQSYDRALDSARDVFATGHESPDEIKEATASVSDFSDSVRSIENSLRRTTLMAEQYAADVADQKRLPGEISQITDNIDELTTSAAGLVGDFNRLEADMASLTARMRKADGADQEKQRALDDAQQRLDEASVAYGRAQAALDEATPETLTDLAKAATASLDRLESALIARDAALADANALAVNYNTLSYERQQKGRELDAIAGRLGELGNELGRLESLRQSLNDQLDRLRQWTTDDRQALQAGEDALAQARSAYNEAKRGLRAAAGSDGAKTAAVTQLIDAAETLIGALEDFLPVERPFMKAWTALRSYTAFNEDAQDQWVYDEAQGRWVNRPPFNNDLSTEDNLLIGARAYLEKYAAWERAADALVQAGAHVDGLKERLYSLWLSSDPLFVDTLATGNELRVADSALRVAQGRNHIAAVTEEVLGQALDEAKGELDAAKADYRRARAVTARKVRAGAVTDEHYAYLNEHKAAYDEAKAAYDEARAAYHEARAAYNKSYAAYWRLVNPEAAQPVKERVRLAVDEYFADTSGYESSSSESSSAPSTAGIPAAKPRETVAAQRSLAQAVGSAASQVEVEGVSGGQVRVTADPIMSVVAEGVFEVESMPEVDVEALVAADPGHSAEDVKEVWWCVTINGVKTRIMDSRGRLAPGIARVVWADSSDLAEATLTGIDLGDGTVVVLTPDTELSLEVVWA